MPALDDEISTELVAMLRNELDVLHRELAQASTERAELRRLLALALQRPALSDGPYAPHETETNNPPRVTPNDAPQPAGVPCRGILHTIRRWITCKTLPIH